MAYKKYAYYNQGNKVAIVEKESSTSRGNLAVAHCTISGYTTKDTCEAAGGQWIPSSSGIGSDAYDKYVSPKETVSQGLEIEYTYSPIYRKFKDNVPYDNLHMASGWTVINGYVAFVSSRNGGTNGVQNWSVATSGSEGDTGGQTLDYVEVTGSSRWNGIHRVQTAGGDGNTLNGGMLITYTKADVKLPVLYNVDLDIDKGTAGSDAYIKGDASSSAYPGDIGIEVGDFIFISGYASDISNNGVFKVTTVTKGVVPASSKLEFDTKYYFPYVSTTPPVAFNEEGTTDVHEGATGELTTENAGDTNITLAKIEHEAIKIRTDVDALNDENDEIDLTSYQAKAIVYYLKAKSFEDSGEFDKREYFMKLFKKQLEKERSARKRGPYIAMGNANMRKL